MAENPSVKKLLAVISAAFVAVSLSVLLFVMRRTPEPVPVTEILKDLPQDVTAVFCLRPRPLLASGFFSRMLQAAREGLGMDADPIARVRARFGMDPETDVYWICVARTVHDESFALVAADAEAVKASLSRLPVEDSRAVGAFRFYPRKDCAIVVLGPCLLGVAENEGGATRMMQTAQGFATSLQSNAEMRSQLMSLDVTSPVFGAVTIPGSVMDYAPVEGRTVAALDAVRSYSFVADCDRDLKVLISARCANENDARQVDLSVKQLLSLVRAAASGEPELATLIDAVATRQVGSAVKVSATLDCSTATAVLRRHFPSSKAGQAGRIPPTP